MDYNTFLESKRITIEAKGFEPEHEIHPLLFDFQKDIVSWALRKGRAAIFAGTGLGKTVIQLEWASHIYENTKANVLILAPLAVAEQTVREGLKLDTWVHLCRTQADVFPGINITNYEMLSHFDAQSFAGVVLDESSILKSFDGSTKKEIIDKFIRTPYKLACTATPAPNDNVELGNHAEFLGVMNRTEMLATFFVHDGGETATWRLKGHAVKDFWTWVSSWAVMLRHPSDLGYDGSAFDLPELRMHEIVVDKSGYAIRLAETLQDRRGARRDSIQDRVSCAAKIANDSDDICMVWCDLNSESDMLKKAINNAVDVKGSDSNEHKTKSMLDFAEGKIKSLVSKASICGLGLNFQVCHKMIFVGLSDSFEQYYQAVRRCWRFGQDKPVDVYIITSEKEGAVVKNIKRKEKAFDEMLKGMIASTQELTKVNLKATERTTEEYNPKIKMMLPRWL